MKNTFTLFLSLSFTTILQGFALTGGPDAHGYTWIDSDAHPSVAPVYQWINISETGTEKLSQGDTDPGVVFDLDGPRVQTYAADSRDIMVSKNGYICFNSVDVGDDATNDCPFPATPNKDSAKRLCVLHDNLDFAPPIGVGDLLKGRIVYQYFPSSPHPHHSCGVHVISWENMVHTGSATRFSFQTLLFDNFDILYQFGENPENGSGSTTGIQQGGTVGLKVACNFPGGIPDNYAVLIEPPTVEITQATDNALRSAMASAVTGTKFVFAPALDGETIEIDPTMLPLGLDTFGARSIDASSLPSGIVLDGGGETPVWHSDARVHFSKVSFRNGAPKTGSPFDAHGGVGLLGDSSYEGSFSACVFQGNDSGNGGGLNMGARQSSFLHACFFIANTASNGGAIWGSRVGAANCWFWANEATASGGAVRGYESPDLVELMDFRECVFTGNTAGNGSGGAIAFVSPGQMHIDRCTLDQNTASFGGAVYNEGGFGFATSSTFSGNDAGLGSAWFAHDTSLVNQVSRCTLADNAEIALYSALGVGHFVVHDSILAGAGEGLPYFSGAGSQSSGGYNLIDRSSAVFVSINDVQVADVGLAPLANNGGPTMTHALLPDSPAIDAADAGSPAVPETDQRGLPRVVGAVPDIGAYEFQGEIVVTTALDENAEPGDGVSLREALTLVAPGGVISFDPSLDGSTIFLNGPLSLTRDVTIDASSLDKLTLSGGGSVAVVKVFSPVSATLRGVEMVDGVSDFGGGLRVRNGTNVSLIDCAVRRCSANEDGGGGGVYVDAGGALTAVRCTLNGNSAGRNARGDNIEVDGGTLVLRDSALSTSGSFESVFVSNSGTLTMNRCTLLNGQWGVILEDAAPARISNCTFSGGVGAIWLRRAELDLMHCTLTDAVGVGGIYNLGGTLRIGHCIVAGNLQAGNYIPMAIFASDDSGDPVTISLGYNLLDTDELPSPQPTDLLNRVPYLAPLANNGGPVLTHATLAISPAINAGDPRITSGANKDGRGMPRVADGRIDIGAHEATSAVIVGHLIDELDGEFPRSLRGALDEVEDGGRIVFKKSLSGGVIDLSSHGGGLGSRLIVDKTVQIDATSLPAGITVSGGGETGGFDLLTGSALAMHAVSVEDGFSGAGQDGGGIRLGNGAQLVLTHACLSGNRAENGGALQAKGGATIYMRNVTLSGNVAQLEGGAMALSGATTSVGLSHCTVTDNESLGAGIGGIRIGLAKATFHASIIADNGDSIGFTNPNIFTSLGYNINDDPSASIAGRFAAAGDLTNTDPALSELSDNGGWAKTHAYDGSPALNAGDPATSGLVFGDGRGYLRRVNTPDIGAYENNGASRDSDGDGMPDYWENLYGFYSSNAADADNDPDLDGNSNLAEFTAGTNPLVSDAPDVPATEIISIKMSSPTTVNITFTSTPGTRYEIQTSTDLKSWRVYAFYYGGEGSATTFANGVSPDLTPELYFRILPLEPE